MGYDGLLWAAVVWLTVGYYRVLWFTGSCCGLL